MRFDDFEENYNGAPLDLEEFAEGAEQLEDSPVLQRSAKQFIIAQEEFEIELAAAGIELG